MSNGAANVGLYPVNGASDEGSEPRESSSDKAGRGASLEFAPWRGASNEGLEPCVRLQLDYAVPTGGEVNPGL